MMDPRSFYTASPSKLCPRTNRRDPRKNQPSPLRQEAGVPSITTTRICSERLPEVVADYGCIEECSRLRTSNASSRLVALPTDHRRIPDFPSHKTRCNHPDPPEAMARAR
jgi:hypothetical protein